MHSNRVNTRRYVDVDRSCSVNACSGLIIYGNRNLTLFYRKLVAFAVTGKVKFVVCAARDRSVKRRDNVVRSCYNRAEIRRYNVRTVGNCNFDNFAVAVVNRAIGCVISFIIVAVEIIERIAVNVLSSYAADIKRSLVYNQRRLTRACVAVYKVLFVFSKRCRKRVARACVDNVVFR